MDNKKLISVLNLQTKSCIGEINKIFQNRSFHYLHSSYEKNYIYR